MGVSQSNCLKKSKPEETVESVLILSVTERTSLLAIPESGDDFIRYYTFNEPDLSRSGSAGGDANRLGFAVQLCLLRYPEGIRWPAIW